MYPNPVCSVRCHRHALAVGVSQRYLLRRQGKKASALLIGKHWKSPVVLLLPAQPENLRLPQFCPATDTACDSLEGC